MIIRMLAIMIGVFIGTLLTVGILRLFVFLWMLGHAQFSS